MIGRDSLLNCFVQSLLIVFEYHFKELDMVGRGSILAQSSVLCESHFPPMSTSLQRHTSPT